MTWLQTASGAALDLRAPCLDGLDPVRDLIEPIARLPRYTGHVAAGPYSVAQHCVIGCDAAWAERRDATIAAAVLLHDLHEAFLGDIATPLVAALGAEAAHQSAIRSNTCPVRRAVTALKRRHDEVIYRAAGLPWPLPDRITEIVASYDIRLLATERAHLLTSPPRPWPPAVEQAQPLRMRGRITPWPWPKAAAVYHERVNRYCPALLDARNRVWPAAAPAATVPL